MYHPNIIEHDVDTGNNNQKLVKKLRSNITELKDIMELAIREDNYELEDSTRTKLRAMVSS